VGRGSDQGCFYLSLIDVAREKRTGPSLGPVSPPPEIESKSATRNLFSRGGWTVSVPSVTHAENVICKDGRCEWGGGAVCFLFVITQRPNIFLIS
jgi:hypothetical protein